MTTTRNNQPGQPNEAEATAPQPDAKALQRRAQILEGALRVFLAQGAHASMDAVAAEAGVCKQTVYSHFKDKQTLFNALIDRLLERFKIAGLTPEIMSLSPQVFMRQIAQVAVKQMDDWEYVSLLRLIIGESARSPELAELYLTRVVNPGVQKLKEYFEGNGTLQLRDPEATGRIIHGALLGFIINQQALNGKHTMPMARERFIESLVDMVIYSGTQHE